MSGPAGTGAAARVLAGVADCARGRPGGIGLFDATTRGFLASLAPLLAFPLVAAILQAAHDGTGPALVALLAAVCGTLAAPVVSHAMARALRRENHWARYAVASNWCRLLGALLLSGPVLAALLLPPSGAMSAGVGLLLLGLALYVLWLDWFLARHALELSRAGAAMLVVVVNVCTYAIVGLPRLIG